MQHIENYKLQEYINTNYRNTELQITGIQKYKLQILEGTASYAALLLALAEGFCLLPRAFLPFGLNKSFEAIFSVLPQTGDTESLDRCGS